jgi:hypothetical protein
MGVHVAGTQHGHTYYLGPLEGSRAPALIALRSRAPAAHVEFWPLQHTIWQIEAGLSYNDMSVESQELIDRLIPEYKGELRENFVKTLQKSCSGIRGRVPGLCDLVRAMTTRYQQAQQTLQRYGNNYEALGQQIVHVVPGEYTNPGPASWSQLNPRVYARVAGGHIWQETSTLEIRVLPSSAAAPVAANRLAGAVLRNASYSPGGGVPPASSADNDTADLPLGAVIAYPDSGAGVQVLGPAIEGGSGPSGAPASNPTFSLALKVVPFPGTYMLFSSADLANLQQTLLGQLSSQGLSTNGTWFGFGVAQVSSNSILYTKLADLLLGLPGTLSDAVADYAEFGTIGPSLGTDWGKQALGLPNPPEIVVNVATSEIRAIRQTQESLLNNQACVPATGQPYVPLYIVGPGQYLVVLATGLKGRPTKLDTSGIVYGFAAALGECGSSGSIVVGFPVSEASLGQAVLARDGVTSGCPSVSASVLDSAGDVAGDVTLPPACSTISQSDFERRAPVTISSSASSAPKSGRADRTIVSHIYAQLRQDPVLRTQNIRVASENGVVTLEGTVASTVQKERVEKIAQMEKDVRLVKSRLVVSGEQPRQPRADGIRSVDFQNFDYAATCSTENGAAEVIHVSEGRATSQDEEFWADKPVYGDLKGDGQEEAVVLLNCHPSGISPNVVSSEIFIFEISPSGAKVLARLPESYWKEERVAGVRVANRQLEVDSLQVANGSQACPEWIVTSRFRWNGNHFINAGETRRKNSCF